MENCRRGVLALFVLTQQKILLAFLITACAVVLLAILAYTGGFLPKHHLRRVDNQIFRANSRNESSRWRRVIEKVMMSLSDQQLVTGLAILLAGYYEMMNSNLSLYHWHMIVWLALLSSSVHIASLTLLRDVLNTNPVLRNLRVTAMLILLVLLSTATWPTQGRLKSLYLPAKCCWTQSRSLGLEATWFGVFDPSWAITLATLLFAYAWKLSQLFQQSRSWVRKWFVAKPQAAIERLMRRAILSGRPRWLTWPAYKLLTIAYLTLVAYAEFAESFAASIVFLLLALPYGITSIVVTRNNVSSDVISGENSLTFGQLVPLLLLILPIMAALELSQVSRKDDNKPEAIYTLLATELATPPPTSYPNLQSALRLNDPSTFESKLPTQTRASHDPIIDHLMTSKAFVATVWFLLAAISSVGLAVIAMLPFVYALSGPTVRSIILMFGGAPLLVSGVPLMLLFVLPFSKKLR